MAHSAAPDPAQAASASAGIRTLVFDVLGTVVDGAGSIAADTAAALAAAGAALAEDHSSATNGRAGWTP
jgi:hypothetical protein